MPRLLIPTTLLVIGLIGCTWYVDKLVLCLFFACIAFIGAVDLSGVLFEQGGEDFEG